MLEVQFLDAKRRYVFVKELGRGTFGCIVLAMDQLSNELVAVKRLGRERLDFNVEAEVVNHSMLWHPHVVQFREVFLTTEHINIVMDYVNAGTLFQYVHEHGRLPEPNARSLFQQLVVAMDYMHRKGVAHRDIKLENLLLQQVPGVPQPLLRVCDLGYSTRDIFSPAHCKVGTVAYMAPEVLQDTSDDGGYDPKAADIWSMGVVLYIMLVCRYPIRPPRDPYHLDAQHTQSMLTQMQHRKFTLSLSSLARHVSPDCINLLEQLLDPNPSSRISMQAIMHHPWFTMALPKAALDMNTRCLALTKLRQQSEKDICHLLQLAQTSCDSHLSCGSTEEGTTTS